MAVSVSLVQLIGVAETRRFWPAKFEALVAQLETDPTNLDQLVVLAGWCEENDEPDLARAFMYVQKRDEEITLLNTATTSSYPWWELKGVKYSITSQEVDCPDHHKTAAGPFARLALQLEAARRDLE